ncbi:MAG: ribosome maturation factor RimM [Thermodesulfobacteriota bacterium]|nr:ribosome maturation factor RimM [Thermodesulfobacteriota bacterium]
MAQEGFLLIGKITGVHGIKGTSKAFFYSESLSAFESDSLILLKNPEGLEKTYEIKWVKSHGRGFLLSLKGISCREEAKALIGSELFIKKDKLPELEDGTYYWFDIIGLAVYTIKDKYLGCVESIISTGSNDVYVVKDKAGNNEVLIPALEAVVKKINFKLKIMQVDLPEGL